MSVNETLGDFIQMVKSGEYRIVATKVDRCEGQMEFAFTVNVQDELGELEREYKDLGSRCDSLASYILTSEFSHLSGEEQDASFSQYNAMSAYQKILRKRIEMVRKRVNEE
ncbi:crAss001_48 related protein [Limosilactobacillus oris]|uniref:crAss001_48 related protein n=1 Tax=Limosilactobacillus oris TaxID=1632 RepID=UPI00223570C9|nr:hypothetical protein [Limosilactobacillus oris]MCW4388759.1 hypothetical protein [Limosilactobacillus oris]